MATLFQLPKAVPISAGEGYAGAKCHFYQAGTTTNITTYTTAALSVAHANPVVADGNGVFAPIFINEAVNTTYKMRLVTSADVLIYEIDNIPTIIDASKQRTAAEISAGVTPVNYYYEPGNVLRYGTNTTPGTTDMTAAAQASIDQAEAGGAAVFIPVGTYAVTSLRVDSANGITIRGEGYQSVLRGPSAGTQIILLVERTGYTAINGMRLVDFRVDGNAGGQFDAGLIQLNNCVNFHCRGLWVHSGSRASGASGVNGIAISAGTLGGTASSGSLEGCVVTGCSKAGFNASTECSNVTFAGCISYSNAGNGSAPGFQVFGGYGTKLMGCTAYSNEGNGFFIGTSGGAGTYRYPRDLIINGCLSYSNGTGATEGHGIYIANAESQAAGTVGRIILSNNICRDNGAVATAASGIRCENQDDIVLDGNLCRGNQASGVIIQNCRRVAITGGACSNNNVVNNAAGSGIYVQTSSTFEVENLSIVGVNFHNSGNQKYPLFMDASNPAGSVYDFKFLDNLSVGHGTSNFPLTVLPKKSHLRHVFDYSTADGSNYNAWYVTLEDDSAYAVNTTVVAKQTDGSNRNSYVLAALAYRDGGSATLQGSVTNISTIESAAGWDSTIVVGSNDLAGRVTGAAATNITWRLALEILSV